MPIHYGSSLPDRDMTPPDDEAAPGKCLVCGWYSDDVINGECRICAEVREFGDIDDPDDEDSWASL